MHPKVRQWTATSAAALVMAYVDTITVSEMQDFALWQAGFAWMGVFAVGCGVLLALINDDAIWSVVAAPVLAVLIFAGVWSYVFWSFLGEYFSYFELLVSTPFLSQVLPQSIVILVTTIPMGLLGVVAATAFRR